MPLTRVTFLVTALVATAASVCWGVSLREEIKIGEQTSRLVEKEMPLSKDRRAQDAIAALGQRLIPYVKRKEIPYHFSIVTTKDNDINAFAVPGGWVYFTQRLWNILTPDERAAILAHEITHCDLRHGIDEQIKAQQNMLWTLPLIVLGGPLGAEAWMVGNMAVSARYSRKAEREADERGLQLLQQARISPAGSVTAMKKLLSISNDTNHYEVSSIFASHPDTQKRVDYLAEKALAMGARPEELQLAAVDDPARLGNVIRKVPDLSAIYARTSTPLQFGQEVDIKKMLWDEDQQALVPTTIAEATVLTPGRLPTLVLTDNKAYHIGDVMVGDGIYPAQ